MTTEDFLIFILPILLLVGAATVGTAFALPPNTTDWNWGIVEHNGSSGYPNELTDDNLEEEEEEQDEKEHEEWAKDNE